MAMATATPTTEPLAILVVLEEEGGKKLNSLISRSSWDFVSERVLVWTSVAASLSSSLTSLSSSSHYHAGWYDNIIETRTIDHTKTRAITNTEINTILIIEINIATIKSCFYYYYTLATTHKRSYPYNRRQRTISLYRCQDTHWIVQFFVHNTYHQSK